MRRLLAALLMVMLTAPAHAQERAWRLGVFSTGAWSPSLSVMVSELARRGFVEGRNLVVLPREDIGSDPDRLRSLAEDLSAAKPDVIVAVSLPAVRAAMAAAPQTPIVTSFVDDPVTDGLAVSLSRPSGKVTGIAMLSRAGDIKRFQLLHEAIPTARRIAYLWWQPGAKDREKYLQGIIDAGRALGVELMNFEASGEADYRGAFDAMRDAQVEGVVIGSSPVFFRDAAAISRLASERHLATVCEWREMAAAGCLIGYGPDITELRVRTADFVARLFAGADPAELPFEQPTHFEMALNARFARAIGLNLPASLIARADEVIE
jgi:putative tryptophan/tyrosine transport system substrate-binding protein